MEPPPPYTFWKPPEGAAVGTYPGVAPGEAPPSYEETVNPSATITGGGKMTLKAGRIVLDGEVDLGGEGGAAVDRTDNNPSSRVRAV